VKVLKEEGIEITSFWYNPNIHPYTEYKNRYETYKKFMADENIPILERNEKNLVYFELTESRENYNKLIINPKPDSLLRIAIHIKKVDKKQNIKKQNLPTFERKGFTAVEWGGVIH
jgi:hypothetical protein